MITTALLRAIGATPARAIECVEPLKAACAFYGIDTPARVTMFLANIGHESGGLKYTRELWGPTAAQLRYEPPSDLAKRLGNTEPGDGKKFSGGGFMQNTGRFNYRRVTQRLRERFPHLDVPDFEQEPEKLSEVQWAALAAADFWDEHGINAYADAGDFDGACDMINRGRKTVEEGDSNGYADRLARWKKVKVALAAQTVDTAEPAAPPPTPISLPIDTNTLQEPDMAPFLAALLPSLLSAVPELAKQFGSGSDVSNRNIKAVEVAASIAKEALGATNEQEVIEKMQSDPAATAAVRDAIKDNWYSIVEAGGGGIAGAREAGLKMQGDRPAYMNPVLWFCASLLPLVYAVVIMVLWPGSDYTSEVKSMVISAVVLTTLGAMVAFWLGSSRGSQVKDERPAGS